MYRLPNSNRHSQFWLCLLAAALCWSVPAAAQLPPLPDPGLPPPIDPPPLPDPFPGTSINFDDLDETTRVSNQYSSLGVVFEGNPRIVRPAPVSTGTWPHCLEVPYGLDIPTHPGPMRFRFTSLQQKIMLRCGRRWAGVREYAVLRVRDDSGAVIATDVEPLGTSAHDVGIQLSVDVGSNRIRRAEVHYVDRQIFDGTPIELDRNGVEIIDNLYFEGASAPPPPPDAAPVVRILEPANGAVFFGSNNVPFGGTITEDVALGIVRFRMEFLDSSEDDINVPLLTAGTAPNFRFPSISSSVFLRPGRNRITVTAVDSSNQTHSHSVVVTYGAAPQVTITSPVADATFSSPRVAVRGRVRKEYGTFTTRNLTIEAAVGGRSRAGVIESVTGSAPNYEFRARVDLLDIAERTFNTITVRATDEGGGSGADNVRVVIERPNRISASMRVTQAVETGFLVTNRRTVARLTPGLSGATVRNIPAELYAFRDGRELPGSPIRPVGGDTIDVIAGETFPERHGDVNKTWNFLLPTTWTDTAGGVDLVGIVDPDNTLGECENCLDNNRVEQTVFFTASERLSVRPVRVTTRDGAGRVMTPTVAQSLFSLEAIRRALPHGELQVLPMRTLALSPLPDPSDLSRIMGEVQSRFTCWDGWFETFFTGCTWSSYAIGLVSGTPGGLATLNAPGSVSEATPWVAAQELVHNIGRSHAGNGHGESSGGGYDGRYPHPHGTIPFYGFDTTDWVVVRPRYTNEADIPSFLRTSFRNCNLTDEPECHLLHDYMSYGRNPYWTSPYTWNGILLDGFGGSFGIGGAAGPVSAPEVVAISGTITGEEHEEAADDHGHDGHDHDHDHDHDHGDEHDSGVDEVHLGGLYRVPTPRGLSLPDSDGDLEVRALGAGGDVLAERRVAPQEVQHSSNHLRQFALLMPFPKGSVAIEIRWKDELVHRADASPSAPTVEVTSPRAGDSYGVEDTVEIRWRGSDSDRDDLVYAVHYSSDGGETWEMLRRDVPGDRLDVPAANLTGSPKALVRVTASDGLNTAQAIAGPFEVADKAPYSVIFWPRDDEEIESGDALIFEASVSDDEDGEISERDVLWSSDRDGVLGRGRRIDVEGLSPGRHTIHLDSKDSAGNRSRSTVEVFVGVDAPSDEPEFLRGDPNGDRRSDIGDAIFLLNYLFGAGPKPTCMDAADANDDGRSDLADSIYLLNYLFGGGPKPPAPFPTPGVDPTADRIGCEESI